MEIHREKDEEKRKALIERKRRDLHIDEKPQDAQERWNRNIDRVQHHGHDADHRRGLAAGTKDHDEALNAERRREHDKPAAARVRVATIAASTPRSGKAEAAAREDDFGVPSKPTPPVKVAEAKPAAAGPKVG